MPSTTIHAKYTKPSDCFGCPLHITGAGYVPGTGPSTAPIVFLGEAPGYDEVAYGEPFVGAAGSMVSRIFYRTMRQRSHYRWENVLRCTPAGYEIKPAWARQAAVQCSQYSRDELLKHPVIVALGGTAIRHALGLWNYDLDEVRVNDYHGTVHELPTGQQVVCTYHPSFLQRGAANLIGTVAFDLMVADEVAAGTWQRDPITPVIDPPLDWFQWWASQFVLAIKQDPLGYWLAVDVETPDTAKGKAEDDLDDTDVSMTIQRVNLAYDSTTGVTVPGHSPPHMAVVKALIEAAQVTLWWNAPYDVRRLRLADIQPNRSNIWDGMWLWHHYQTDVPRGLGFAAPHFSRHGAWKHLFRSNPAEYAAYDGPQTYRTVEGVVDGLRSERRWESAYRHTVTLLNDVLYPASAVGVQADRKELEAFTEDLTQKIRYLLARIQEVVPLADRPLTGGVNNTGFRRPPTGPHPDSTIYKADGSKKGDADAGDEVKLALYRDHTTLLELQVERPVLCCSTCGASEVVHRHRCQDKTLTPQVAVEPRLVTRWFWQEPFNPDSPAQVLDYIIARKHLPGRNKKTRQPSADKDTLKRLRASTKDPLYALQLDYRAVQKIRSTYAIGVLKRLDTQDRFHSQFTLAPDTLRTSARSPNIQNVTTDRQDQQNLASGFRRVIVASPGCELAEFDYAGIEAVQVGWYARDKDYYRLAGLGVHAYVASHLIRQPADLSQDDPFLLDYFKWIKTHYDYEYNQAKRTVHGNGYGMTAEGMHLMFPGLYPTIKEAQYVRDVYFATCPQVPAWQKAVKLFGHEAGYLGGMPDPHRSILDQPFTHPYGYLHYYYGMMTLRPVGQTVAVHRREKDREPIIWIHDKPYRSVPGDDANRGLAFFPQSTAAGNIKEAAIELCADPNHPSYIGHTYHGQTPLRAIIHDSLFLEYEIRYRDYVHERVFREMLRPIEEQPLPEGWPTPYMTIGVEAKIGQNWQEMQKISTPSCTSLGLDRDHYVADWMIAADRMYGPADESGWEELEDLRVRVEVA